MPSSSGSVTRRHTATRMDRLDKLPSLTSAGAWAGWSGRPPGQRRLRPAAAGSSSKRQPWSISDAALTVISYKYAVPGDLYDPENGVVAKDLL